jgi:alkanesulfonate monooxygenase SsuD/methylene tetrahydromethanopterin reductase-like flavin-dependent oxidoreductase (luciferase family)
MFEEALEQVQAIWASNGAINVEGKFWKISTGRTHNAKMGQGEVIKPKQQPHPPLLGGALDPDSKSLVNMGRRGWLMASGNMVHENWLPAH